MKKLLIYISLLICLHAAAARTFYIAPNGSDANTASQAQNPATPWKILGLHSSTLLTGDIVLFQRNGTYTDSISLNISGVTLAAYGTGAQPNITGFYNITSWTNLGGGIYESEAIPTNIGVNLVAINNKSYAMGRYPNAGTSNDGYLTFESHSGSTSITDNQKPTFLDATFAGAQLITRVAHYMTGIATISGISGNTITFSGFTTQGGGSLSDNYGYFVQNSKNTLDQFGEWYYNPGTKKIDVFFGSAGPTGNTVQIAVKDKVLYNKASNTTITGLTFSGGDYCIYSDGTLSNLTIDSCTMQLAAYSHMLIANMTNTTITNTTFSWGNLNGAVWNFQDNGITVRNCKFDHIGTFVGMIIKDPNSGQYGIALCTGATDNVMLDNNQFKNIGYVGIRFNEGNNLTVQNNRVDSFMTTLDDAAAYYTWRNANNVKTLHDRFILNNTATNCLATGFGTPSTDGVWGGNFYCDDNAYNIVIKGNTGANGSGNGLYMHNAHDITVTNNTFYNNGESQIEISDDGTGGPVSALLIRNNQLLAKTTGQLLMNCRSSNNNFNTFFTDIDSNYYGRAPNDAGAFVINWFSNSFQTKNLADWKTYIADESHSRGTNITDVSKIVFNVNSNAVIKRVSFCTPMLGLDNTSYIKKASVTPNGSILMMKQ